MDFARGVWVTKLRPVLVSTACNDAIYDYDARSPAGLAVETEGSSISRSGEALQFHFEPRHRFARWLSRGRGPKRLHPDCAVYVRSVEMVRTLMDKPPRWEALPTRKARE